MIPDPSPPAPPPVEETPLFTAIAAASEDGLLVVETDRRISFVNEAAGTLLGRAPSDLTGLTTITALRDFQADQAIERALDTGVQEAAIFQVYATALTLSLTCQPIGGTDAGAVVMLRDVTRLAQLERARREMVANVSHELATPLASARLLVETLMSGPPPSVMQRLLRQLNDQLTDMTQLIDELRELSQIEAGRLALRMQPTSIAELVNGVVGRMEPQVERHGLELVVDVPSHLPLVMVDPDSIGRVLRNLLHNALKWTPDSGCITISAGMADQSTDELTAQWLAEVEGPGWLKLSVRDTGIGIPASEIERIFERFYKVDRARTRDGAGTGLGLAIAKHLVERHGGRIWAESREGHGSMFSLLLPMAQ